MNLENAVLFSHSPFYYYHLFPFFLKATTTALFVSTDIYTPTRHNVMTTET